VVAQAALVGAFLPHRPPPDRPRSALGNIYRTSDDHWLQLTGVREDKMRPTVCQAVGQLPQLCRFVVRSWHKCRADPEMSDVRGRPDILRTSRKRRE
jgi:formyl-CoA transferase